MPNKDAAPIQSAELAEAINAARAAGRAEAVAIIMAMDPEDPLSECIAWGENGDCGDHSAYWCTDKLQAVFKTDDLLMNMMDKAEADAMEAHFMLEDAKRAATPAQPIAAEPVRDLSFVIQWLEGGCDPMEAAKELRLLQAAQPIADVSAPSRLDLMSLIRSQMHRSYTAGHEGGEIDPKYITEIEDAVAGIYHGRYIAGYDLRKSEESAPAADVSAPTDERTNLSHKNHVGQGLRLAEAIVAEQIAARAAAPVSGQAASICPLSENGRALPGADKFIDLMRDWRHAPVGGPADDAFKALVQFIDSHPRSEDSRAEVALAQGDQVPEDNPDGAVAVVNMYRNCDGEYPTLFADMLRKVPEGTRLFAAPESSGQAAQEQARCCLHDSDCAVHNAPALPVGPCDCALSQEQAASDAEKAFLDAAYYGTGLTIGGKHVPYADIYRAAPPAPTAQSLTDADIERLWNAQRKYHGGEPCKVGHAEFARAIERHLAGGAA